MERNHRERDGYEGRLPAMAPLANPYVPFQTENPPQYEAGMGMARGTLFPGLDLPFMGMVNEQAGDPTQLMDLQALAFAIQELALYLDTHREDKEALETYREYQKMYHRCAEEYAKTHGPLTHNTPMDGAYRWLDDPWPWEFAKSKED